MAVPILLAFTIFSSFPIIIGDILQSAAVAIDQLGTDGGQFFKRIVHGDKITYNPGYLLFTAPYKLCEEGCEDTENNFAMAFPIYVGKRGKEKYKELYERDYKNIRSTKSDAPFKKRPTKKLFTLCPSEVTEETTMATTETETILIESTVKSTPTFSELDTRADAQTVSEIDTRTTNTPTMITTTETPLSETTMTKIMTVAITTKTPTIFETGMPTTTILNTEPIIEKTNIPTNELPEVTETEDITFESYADDSIISEHEETTFVTNANGVRCPSRICWKKIKVTPSIVTLIFLILMMATLQSDQANMPWSRWSWTASQKPVEYYFRRNQNMPVKTPGHQCQCPPSKECIVDFKINEDAIVFLNIRGVLNEENVQQIKEDIEKMEPVQKNPRTRRNNDETHDEGEECCCPPRSVMMPTFITDSKFNETVQRLKANETANTN